jgi:protein tyrosine/serine phosphatase
LSFAASVIAIRYCASAGPPMVTRRIKELREEVLQNCKSVGSEIVQHRTVRRLLLIAFLLLGCRSTRSFVCDPTPHAPRNFGEVSVQIYRGGQPMTCGELAYLKAAGVKTILKLNDRNSPVDEAEKSEAARLGMRIESFAFDPRTIGSRATCPDVQRAIAFIENPANQPIFIHCTAGKDRTGYIVGLYERESGRSIEDVMSELHRYGHRAARSAAFSQIDRELQRERPQCAP